MDTIEKAVSLIEECILGKPFKKITFSSPLKKSNPNFKIAVQPMQNKKGSPFYQFSIYYDTKVKHENYVSDDAIEKIAGLFHDGYKQCDIILYGENIKILTNKNNLCKILKTKLKTENTNTQIASHDAEKNYILKENHPVPWLISLGIMENNGGIVPKYYKKFRQLNKFLEIISDIYGNIPDGAEIIDVGCGKSYLTFALYYYLNIIKNKNVFITGLDIKKDVVLECQRLADMFGFKRLKFIAENIETYRHHNDHADMVITLHACDTATDYALYGAVKWGADIVLSAPCCQHELFTQIQNEDLRPLLKHGILKERFTSLLTDSLRSSLLEIAGYKCVVMEFIEMEHTPKNIMIKAIKKSEPIENKSELISFMKLMNMFSVKPKLYELLLKEGFIKA